jgi:membrane-bound lytic murein transglycosylase D
MHPLRAVVVLCFIIEAGCTTTAPDTIATPVSPTPNTAPSIEPQVTLVAPAQSTEVWDVLRSGFALNHESHRPAVARAVDVYRKRGSLVSALQARGQRYFAYITEEVRQRNMPMEVALLPIVESMLDPYAFSGSGAAGLWQLLPGTAKRHGVTIDAWYDGRRDLLDSTSAALDYLTYLHDEFDNWLLAIAAYNSGEGRVKKALRHSSGSGFFELKLPKETQRYIPQVLALAHLIAAGDGIELPSIDSEMPFFVATIHEQIDLGTLTSRSSLPIAEMFYFNPGLNRRATPPHEPYQMLVPVTYRSAFETALDAYPAQTTKWQPHRVKRGETLTLLAQRYHTSVATIRAHNALPDDLIRPNQTLLIPNAANETNMFAANPMLSVRATGLRYKTRSGDSLWSISRKFNVSIGALVRANRLDKRTPLMVGQVLIVPGHAEPERVSYTVRRGDSLARIASQHNVSVAQIIAWNGVDPAAALRPGLRLVLPTGSRLDPID